MYQVRIALFVVFIFNFFGDTILSQTIAASDNEVINLTHQAAQYLKKADFEKSLKLSKIALQKAIIQKDEYSVITSYITIAANYAEMSEFDKAVFYYTKALSFANKIDNNTLKSRITNNLGNIYCFEKKQYIKGINFYEKALRYSEKIADTSLVFMIKLNITWAYFDVGYFDKGYENLKFINAHNAKYGNESTAVALQMLNGMYYSQKKNHNKATSFFLSAIKLGKKVVKNQIYLFPTSNILNI